MATWPSCPMLTRPARVETIAPSATSSSGAASASVPPHRPGLAEAAVEHRAEHLLPRTAGDRDEHRRRDERECDRHHVQREEHDAASSSWPRRAGRIFIVSDRSVRGDATEQQAEALGRGLGAIELTDDPTARHDDDAVGQIEDLLQLGRRSAARRCRRRPPREVVPVVYSIAPTSRPRVGWAATSTFGWWLSSRASTTRCWLPPDRLRIGASGAAPWISNSAISSSARRRSAGLADEPEAGDRTGPIDEQVLGDRHVEHASRVVAILGDHRHAMARHAAGAAGVDGGTVDRDRCRRRGGSGSTSDRRARADRCPPPRRPRRSRRRAPRRSDRSSTATPSRTTRASRTISIAARCPAPRQPLDRPRGRLQAVRVSGRRARRSRSA